MENNVLEEMWGEGVAREPAFLALPRKALRLMALLPLTYAERLLLIAINSFRTPGSSKFPFPSNRLLGELTGLSPATVNRMVHSLEERGFLLMPEQGKRGRGHSTSYDIQPLLTKMAGVAELLDKNTKVQRSEPSATGADANTVTALDDEAFLAQFKETASDDVSRAAGTPAPVTAPPAAMMVPRACWRGG